MPLPSSLEIPNDPDSPKEVSSTVKSGDETRIVIAKENVSSETTAALKNVILLMEKDVEARGDVQRPWKHTDFEIAKLLGCGQFGRVFLAREKRSKLVVGLKVLRKKDMDSSRCQHQVLREIEIQSHLKHPNVLALYGYFWDSTYIYLVLEYAEGGEMFTVLQSQPNHRFEPIKTARYIYQVSRGLEYCHSQNVMHRDIKPENLLLDIRDNVKLADFGWSVHAPSDRRRTKCGTLDYLPPEMVESKHYTKKVDHWCLGILLYEFSTGRPPFESTDEVTTCRRIKECKVKYPSFMEAGVVDLVSRLLQHDPMKRATFEDVRKHPWIVANLESPS